MHVLMIPSWYPTHQRDVRTSYMREQALALAARPSCKVGVIYPYFRDPERDGEVASFENDEGIATFRAGLPRWMRRVPYGSAWSLIRTGLRLYERYERRQGRPDVLHAQVVLYGALVAAAISRRHGIPLVITEHNSGYARGLVKPWQLSLGSGAVARASACTAVGERFAELLEKTYGSGAGTWRYLPNMVSPLFFDRPLPASRASTFTFCSISNLNRNKGVDILLRAFARAFGGDRSVRLEIGGTGPELSQLQQLCASLGIQEQVAWLGPLQRAEVVEHLAASQAFVLASHYETFGIVLAEALALGKPVVATRCGGPESIVTPSDGLLVAPGNVAELAQALRRVRQEHETFDAQRIRESCRARFAAPKFVDRLLDVYRDALRQGEPVLSTQ